MTAERFLDEKKSLACIHCGLCLSSCPTYLETGNENDSPRGRIHLMRAIQDGRMALDAEPVRHIDLCLGCRACEAACPSGVEYGHLLEHTRDHIERHHTRPLFERLLRRVAIEQVFPHPSRLRVALALGRAAKRFARWLPRFAREALALVPDEADAVEAPLLSPAEGETRARVGFITGCAMTAMFGSTNTNTIRLLTHAGCEVVAPPAQGCCGALHAHTGNLRAARSLARRNIAAFEKQNLDAIIINAAGCGSTLKEYPALLAGDAEWLPRACAFSAKVRDITEFLVTAGFNSKLQTSNSKPQTVTYHDACHLAHAQRITKQPRELVKAAAGASYVELPEADVCCGSAGTYNLTEPEMAARLQRRKIENILRTGAHIVVTSNPGCLLQIRAGLAAAGAHDVEALHIADYLARQIT